MSQLQVIEHQNQRLLTTTQLAKAYGTTSKIISNNFTRNRERYEMQKHYIALQGENKQDFLNRHQIEDGSKNANVLYLWTEKGAWLHAKSLGTDEAWEAYEMLVDDYYMKKEQLSERESWIQALKLTIDTAEKQEMLENKVIELEHKIDEQITLDHGEQRRIQKAVSNRVYSYTNDKSEASRLFRELYREIKDRFGVASYKDVKRKELEKALNYISYWVPRKVS